MNKVNRTKYGKHSGSQSTYIASIQDKLLQEPNEGQ